VVRLLLAYERVHSFYARSMAAWKARLSQNEKLFRPRNRDCFLLVSYLHVISCDAVIFETNLKTAYRSSFFHTLAVSYRPSDDECLQFDSMVWVVQEAVSWMTN